MARCKGDLRENAETDAAKGQLEVAASNTAGGPGDDGTLHAHVEPDPDDAWTRTGADECVDLMDDDPAFALDLASESMATYHSELLLVNELVIGLSSKHIGDAGSCEGDSCNPGWLKTCNYGCYADSTSSTCK